MKCYTTKRILLAVLCLAVLGVILWGVQQFRMQKVLLHTAFTTLYQDTVSVETVVSSIDEYLENGEARNANDAYWETIAVSSKWQKVSALSCSRASALNRYELRRKLTLDDITVSLSVESCKKAVDNAAKISSGFYHLQSFLSTQRYADSICEESCKYLESAAAQLRELDSLMAKYDLQKYSYNSKEYLTLHMAMYSDLEVFADAFEAAMLQKME